MEGANKARRAASWLQSESSQFPLPLTCRWLPVSCRAGLFMRFQLDPSRGMLQQCGRVAETGNMCYIAKLWCPAGVENRTDVHDNMLGVSAWGAKGRGKEHA